MHSVLVQDRVLWQLRLRHQLPCMQGQDTQEWDMESCTTKALGLDFTEVFRCLPSLTARGMSEVSSAAAGKQIPLSYF